MIKPGDATHDDDVAGRVQIKQILQSAPNRRLLQQFAATGTVGHNDDLHAAAAQLTGSSLQSYL